TVEELADLFVADIVDGIDANDYCGPVVRRTPHRAGVVKVAGSDGGPSPRDARVFAAAAEAHRRTGVPILTHCEGGTGALEQILLLVDAGVEPSKIVVSHVDKIVDPAYHRASSPAGRWPSTTRRFAGATAPTARWRSSRRWPRTGCATGSCSAWTP